ncbi:MAG TPA: universal stress protein [Burkholderiaceae bacterium]|nr:universal stress protein [Burkholderiaceae bacterium]
MQRILIPVDGSASAEFAVRHVINNQLGGATQEIHLLNVQPKLSRHIARFVGRKDLQSWHREMADKALAPARVLLEQHNIPHAVHHALGDRAETIVSEAKRLKCHLIVMNTAKKRTLARMFQASTTFKVLEKTTVPVELISGARISVLEGWGLPAGLGALIGMIVMASSD